MFHKKIRTIFALTKELLKDVFDFLVFPRIVNTHESTITKHYHMSYVTGESAIKIPIQMSCHLYQKITKLIGREVTELVSSLPDTISVTKAKGVGTILKSVGRFSQNH